MAVLVDERLWWYRGQHWCHLVSDESLAELHEFAAGLGIPRLPGGPLRPARGPQPKVITAGAVAVPAGSCSAAEGRRPPAGAGGAPGRARQAGAAVGAPRHSSGRPDGLRGATWTARRPDEPVEQLEAGRSNRSSSSNQRSRSLRPVVRSSGAGRTEAKMPRAPRARARPPRPRAGRLDDVVGGRGAVDHEAGAPEVGAIVEEDDRLGGERPARRRPAARASSASVSGRRCRRVVKGMRHRPPHAGDRAGKPGGHPREGVLHRLLVAEGELVSLRS